MVLEGHEAGSHETPLKYILGDGYLYKNNSFYKNIRDELLRIGYTFSEVNDAFTLQYQAYSTLFLNEIYKNRKIPYRDNVTPLYKIKENSKTLNFPVETFSREHCQKVMHESVHCILLDFFGIGIPDYTKAADKNSFIVSVLAGEAWANTIDNSTPVLSTDQIHRSVMLMNSFGSSKTRELCNYYLLKRTIGEARLLEFIFFSYLFSNYYYYLANPPPGLFQDILDYLELNKYKHVHSHLEDWLEHGFTLNPNFRSVTLSVYFQQIGCGDILAELRILDLKTLVFSDEILKPVNSYFLDVLLGKSPNE
jgi:hypothetical protein